MLTPQGQVKLLDLGLARFEQAPPPGEEMTGAGQPMGTADYMAPEQVSDSRAADIRADIYSLGCTLFKLLTGHAPFSGAGGQGTFDKLSAHVNDPVPSIADYDASLPEDLVRLIARMLAKSPEDRPATPAEVAAALAPHCRDSDLAGLESLAAEAERQRGSRRDADFALPPREAVPAVKDVLTPASRFESGWIWAAVAAIALLAGGGGFALGVIITIERNGKKTTLEVPDGSRVGIDEAGRVNVQPPSTGTAATTEDRSDFQAVQGVWQVVERKGKSFRLLNAGRTLNPNGTYSEDWKSSRIEITAGACGSLVTMNCPSHTNTRSTRPSRPR